MSLSVLQVGFHHLAWIYGSLERIGCGNRISAGPTLTLGLTRTMEELTEAYLARGNICTLNVGSYCL